MERSRIGQVELAYEESGSGEPVLLIHGAHIADALAPLTKEPAMQRLRLIRYHRRGVGASTRPATGPTSIGLQVGDGVGLLDHLGVASAHVVGHSLGGAIALALAADHPGRVRTLSLLEPPPPFSGSSGRQFIAAVEPLVERYLAGDAEGAVHGFLALVGDRDWRGAIDGTVPGGIAQAVRDAATFFETELAIADEWNFGADEAAAITCPVLSVVGTATAPLFLESRDLIRSWFPGCHEAEIADASHLLQMEKPREVAEAISAFISAPSVERRPSQREVVA